MIKLLVRKCIKNYENTSDPKVRERYGVLGGILGIICNITLFIIKIIIGNLVMSSSIISDAFNNLSDMGSNLVSTISAKLSSKKPDKDHPFGHGRLEYIASLIVSFLIIFMGLQIIMTSTTTLIKVFKGEETVNYNLDWILIGILLASILIKVWMFSYNMYLSKKINSPVLKAAAIDSISDVITSLVIIVTTIIGALWLKTFPLDSVLSIIVGLIIAINGLKMTIETISDLLGKPADPEIVDKLDKLICSGKGVYGTHDLIIHDYGPGRMMASAHVEVSDKANIVAAHEMIDELEVRAMKELQIPLVLHMDPISIDDPIVNDLRSIIHKTITEMNDKLSFHDLRITNGENRINVIFDLVIPYEYSKNEKEYVTKIKEAIKLEDKRFIAVIKIDH